MFDAIDGTSKQTATTTNKKNIFDDIDNEFKISNEPDNRNVVDAISDIGPGTIADNASAWDAFIYGAKLGFTDTARGVTQMAGGEKKLLGVFEMEKFAEGTIGLGNAIAEATINGAFSLVGGGDSVAAVKQFGFADKVSYVSTGGGAMLEMLEGQTLPGIEAILK